MPDPTLLTPLGKRMLGRWPPFLRNVPEFIAIAHACAKITEYTGALLEQVREQASPRRAGVLLKEWEVVFGAPIEPAGQSIEQRQNTVMAYVRRLRGVPYGVTWNQKLAMLASAYTVAEHDPDDPASPAAYVVRVTIPFAPGSERYEQLAASLREFTPAHEELQIIYDTEGFLLDFSLLDLEEL